MDRRIRKLEILWGIPILSKTEGSAVRGFGTFPDNENPLVCYPELAALLIKKADAQIVPVVYKDGHGVYFLCFRSKERYYFSGPVCAESMSYVEIHRYYKDYGIRAEQERHPMRRSLLKILNFVSFFYELLEDGSVDVSTLMAENHLAEPSGYFTERENTRMEMEKIDEEAYHHTYQEERFMMDCLREGRAEEAAERMSVIAEKTSRFSRNELTDKKYLVVIYTTMATREAIIGGASPAKAYRVSDLLINEADRCKTIDAVTEILYRVTYEFADLILDSRKNKEKNSYTEQCKDYIMQNYHHKISLEEMAEAIGISAGHLSRVFRQDTGMTVQEYIQRARVERAANLLKYSEASLTEISDYVCFHSQSHFGSVFKKYMDMTPGEYRNRYKQKEFCSMS